MSKNTYQRSLQCLKHHNFIHIEHPEKGWVFYPQNHQGNEGYTPISFRTSKDAARVMDLMSLERYAEVVFIENPHDHFSEYLNRK